MIDKIIKVIYNKQNRSLIYLLRKGIIMAKKLLSVLLAVLMCFAVILMTACNNDGDTSADELTDASNGAESTEPEGEHFLLEQKDWNTTIKILLCEKGGDPDFSTIVVPEEDNTGDPINDAFAERNNFIKQNYGITLELVKSSTNISEAIERIRNDSLTGEPEYQIISIPLTYIAPLAVEGLLYDIKEVDKNGYIHYNEAWWDQAAIRDLTINNKLWFLAGDALIEDDEATWAIYFNKDLYENYGLKDQYGSIYDVVKDGAWTLDKFHEMTTLVHKMNGSTMSYEPEVGDVWGAVVQSYDCYAFMLGAAQPMIVLDADGVPYFRVEEEENMSTFMKVMDIMLDSENVGVADFFGAWNSGVYTKEAQIFCNGNALFRPGTISTVSGEAMRTAEIHYGILPMPKANELQDEYTTSVSVYWCQVLSIPRNNTSLIDATCYALEAMAFYGKQYVTPEYYNRTLTLKRFEDTESGEMLDLVFRNRTYDLAGIFDFGTVNGNGAGSLYFYTSLLGSKQNVVTSLWAAKSDLFNSALQDLMNAVAD